MVRNASFGLGMLAALALPAAADAQVHVRAPFVRVDVGAPGVHVRAPFVNLFIARRPRYHPPPAPVIIAPPAIPAPSAGEPEENLPAPAVLSEAMTLADFARGFKPQAGNYELVLLNPVTNAPTTVRFSLPPGTPRRVEVERREIEFDYGPRRYVRIRFDRDGAEVTSR